MSLDDLAQYAAIGVRTLRDAIKDTSHPLPHVRTSRKKILVKRSDFDEWLESFRVGAASEVDRIVAEVLG
jgi:excisionase family DNA binding protein